MMRMIFLSAPSSSASFSRLTPASMETKMPSEARMSALRLSTTPTTICGLTPRKTKRLSERMRCGVSAVQPSRCAAASERSRVEHATAMRSPPVFFAVASASAPPILPAPMKPASYFAIRRPS